MPATPQQHHQHQLSPKEILDIFEDIFVGNDHFHLRLDELVKLIREEWSRFGLSARGHHHIELTIRSGLYSRLISFTQQNGTGYVKYQAARAVSCLLDTHPSDVASPRAINAMLNLLNSSDADLCEIAASSLRIFAREHQLLMLDCGAPTSLVRLTHAAKSPIQLRQCSAIIRGLYGHEFAMYSEHFMAMLPTLAMLLHSTDVEVICNALIPLKKHTHVPSVRFAAVQAGVLAQAIELLKHRNEKTFVDSLKLVTNFTSCSAQCIQVVMNCGVLHCLCWALQLKHRSICMLVHDTLSEITDHIAELNLQQMCQTNVFDEILSILRNAEPSGTKLALEITQVATKKYSRQQMQHLENLGFVGVLCDLFLMEHISVMQALALECLLSFLQSAAQNKADSEQNPVGEMLLQRAPFSVWQHKLQITDDTQTRELLGSVLQFL